MRGAVKEQIVAEQGVTAQALIEVRDVAVGYSRRRGLLRRDEKVWVFRDLSFDLLRGESLGVVGNNGVGKSTLLRLLAGIIDPDQGSVVNHGAKAALMSLAGGFYPELNGVQNILLGGVLLGYTEQEVQAKLDTIIEFAELADDIHRPVNTYSAGMKARLSFARAAMLEADVLLIDEVLSVGDKNFRGKCEEFMRQRIQSEQTLVYVSHNEKTVCELCNRALWIDAGQARLLGPAEEVMEQYLAA
ncbi:MAG: ATP-binding cassette domain-containing protein [Gammaproteobacteria bacterium]|nr:ATP-binding cassette domain-containing protein [Gammaproteobacteria bacterium]